MQVELLCVNNLALAPLWKLHAWIIKFNLIVVAFHSRNDETRLKNSLVLRTWLSSALTNDFLHHITDFWMNKRYNIRLFDRELWYEWPQIFWVDLQLWSQDERFEVHFWHNCGEIVLTRVFLDEYFTQRKPIHYLYNQASLASAFLRSCLVMEKL